MALTGRPSRVLLVGAHGHGISHLRNIRRLEEQSVAELVAVCDTQRPHGETATLAEGVPWGSDAAEFATTLDPDIVVVCTPIHTHLGLADLAMRAGADVLLEKPPVPGTAEFRQLGAVAGETGRVCQVGFQSFGSEAVDHLRSVIATGAIGPVHGIGVFGAWVRAAAYWQRSAWAGRRMLDGHAVVDGAVTNPFAHATATALRIDGSDRLGDLARVEAELFHANPIEADDTSSVRITTNRGTTIAIGLTLCGRADQDPYIVVHGEDGRAVFWYTRDRMLVAMKDAETTREYGRTDLLTDLIAYRARESAELIAPLERTGAFTEVVQAIRVTEPLAIPDERQDVVGAGLEQHRVLPGVESVLERVSTEFRLFSELDVPWV
jgi:predicted dehydrogenase